MRSSKQGVPIANESLWKNKIQKNNNDMKNK